MNLRNKKLLTTIRVLFGVLMIFSGASGLASVNQSMEGMPAPMIEATKVLVDTGLFHMIKITELVAGLMLVAGFLPALAAIFIAPIAVGIVVFNLNVAPMYAISGLVVCVLNAYLGYAYWESYKSLFKRD
jgi:uncharacterized membrane protein YphA (DoxX/SURF4 family)